MKNAPHAGSLLDQTPKFMAKIVDSIKLLPNTYKEKEGIGIFRVTERVEQAFPEIIKFKVQLKRERRQGRKHTPILKSDPN